MFCLHPAGFRLPVAIWPDHRQVSQPSLTRRRQVLKIPFPVDLQDLFYKISNEVKNNDEAAIYVLVSWFIQSRADTKHVRCMRFDYFKSCCSMAG